LNPAHYSLQWSRNTVTKLRIKYARATEFVSKMWGLSDEDWAKFLAYKDPMYPVLRDIVHKVDTWLTIHGRKPDYYTLVEYFSLRSKFIYSGNIEKRLWDRFFYVKLKEQGSRGDGARGEADGPIQHLLFSEADLSGLRQGL